MNKERSEYLQRHDLFLKRNPPKSYYFCSQNLTPFREVAEFLDSNNTNSLLIYGKNGVGKTHLIGCSIQNTFFNSLYIDSSDFISTFYKHLKQKIPLQVLFDWLLSHEVLIFDSFHLVKDKPTIKELFTTLIKQVTKQKIIFIWTTDEEKLDLSKEEINIELDKCLKLNEPTKNCLKTISDNFFIYNNKNLKLTNNALELILETIHPDFRTLMDVLSKLLFFYGHATTPTPIGTAEIKKTLDKLETTEVSRITPEESNEQLLLRICKKLKFDPEEVKAETRKKEVVYKRNIVIYLIKKQSNLSHEEIGRIFNKNHSTVTHSIKQIEEKLEDKYFREYLKTFL